MAIGYDNLDLVTDLVENLNSLDYVADPAIATSLHLAQMLGRPLLIAVSYTHLTLPTKA